jgi:hypothetical protein
MDFLASLGRACLYPTSVVGDCFFAAIGAIMCVLCGDGTALNTLQDRVKELRVLASDYGRTCWLEFVRLIELQGGTSVCALSYEQICALFEAHSSVANSLQSTGFQVAVTASMYASEHGLQKVPFNQQVESYLMAVRLSGVHVPSPRWAEDTDIALLALAIPVNIRVWICGQAPALQSCFVMGNSGSSSCIEVLWKDEHFVPVIGLRGQCVFAISDTAASEVVGVKTEDMCGRNIDSGAVCMNELKGHALLLGVPDDEGLNEAMGVSRGE